MQNRAEALQNVESTIVELSTIFTQLATMVAQQGEVAIRYVICKFYLRIFAAVTLFVLELFLEIKKLDQFQMSLGIYCASSSTFDLTQCAWYEPV